jgi:hypothetical protein
LVWFQDYKDDRMKFQIVCVSFFLLLFGQQAQAATQKCDAYIKAPPTNVRVWGSKNAEIIHEITTKQSVEILQNQPTNGWYQAKVWVAPSTYKEGWIHNSQITISCWTQLEYSDLYYTSMRIGQSAKEKGDFNTSLINYRRALDEFKRLNPNQMPDEYLESQIALMESKLRK